MKTVFKKIFKIGTLIFLAKLGLGVEVLGSTPLTKNITEAKPYYLSDFKINNLTIAPGDADNDGIADLVDLCPATAIGTSVNAYGCALNLSSCNYNSTTLNLNSAPASPSPTQVNSYILTDSIGIIKAISSTPTFSGLLRNKNYMAVAFSYENDGSLVGLTVGQPLNGINANCKDFSSALLIKICLNLPPTIQNANFPLAYNAPNGTSVGTVVFSDPEALPVTLAITSGNTSNIFAINNLGQITVINAAAITPGEVYTLQVEVTDNLGQKATNTVTITTSTNNDHDGDGVPNNLDLCPGTPIGTPVNAYGCPKTLATCNAPSNSVSLNASPNSPQAGQVNAYVLTDSVGIIKFISTTPSFTGLTYNKTYMAVAVSYLNDGSLLGLTVDQPLSGIAAACMDKSDAILIKVCAPILGKIGSTVWIDSNDNGLQDLTESGIGNIKVYLWKTNALGVPTTLIDSSTTTALGAYAFNSLLLDDYAIQIKPSTVPSSYKISTKPNTGNDNTDSDVLPATGFSGKITLTSLAPNSLYNNAGLVPVPNCKPICVEILIRKLK